MIGCERRGIETYGSEVAVGSELLQGGADGNVEEKDPRNSDLLPHLGRKSRSAAYLEEGSVSTRTLRSTDPIRGLSEADRKECGRSTLTIFRPYVNERTHLP